MKATAQDVLTTKIYFMAAFPALRIPLEEDPSFAKKFEKIDGVVEFRAADDENPVACYMVFLTQEKADASVQGKRFKVYQGEYPGYIDMADGSKFEPKVVKMYFKSIKSLLGVFKGDKMTDMLGIMGPLFKNITNGLTLNFLFLMLTLMKTMPNYVPKDDKDRYMKVKLSLSLITRALSSANKLGWKTMQDFTIKQPDRTYQFTVGATVDDKGNEICPRITANLRVKNGKSKATSGEAKYPFVLFKFPNPNGCLEVLNPKNEFVANVENGYVEIIGAGDSYAVTFNTIMTQCQNMLIPAKFGGVPIGAE